MAYFRGLWPEFGPFDQFGGCGAWIWADFGLFRWSLAWIWADFGLLGWYEAWIWADFGLFGGSNAWISGVCGPNLGHLTCLEGAGHEFGLDLGRFWPVSVVLGLDLGRFWPAWGSGAWIWAVFGLFRGKMPGLVPFLAYFEVLALNLGHLEYFWGGVQDEYGSFLAKIAQTHLL